MFQPTEGDTITLQNVGAELGTANDCTILEMINDRKMKIDIQNYTGATTLTTGNVIFPCSPTACFPGSATITNPRFMCNSDFGNQFMSNWKTFVNGIAYAIGQGLGVVINAAGDVINTVASPIANLVTTVINAGAGVAKAGFCATVPILCDSTIWIILGLGLLGLIIFIVLS
jgi:hypothetical protein